MNDQDIMKSMKKREVVMGKVVVCAFVLSILVLVFAGVMPVVAATTWTVDDSGGADFTTIQAAVDAASEGDTISVRDGTYIENVNVNKRLMIRSENGTDVTVVQAVDPDDHVFEVTADSVEINGFKVMGVVNYGGYEAGIYVVNADEVGIIGNVISETNNGIHLHSSYNSIINNNTYGSGISSFMRYNGIYLVSSLNITIINNNISRTTRGIYLFSSSDNTLTNNKVSDNAGGILITSSSSNNHISNNNASENHWYGVYIESSSDNIIRNNIVNSNNWGGYYSSNIQLYSANNNIIDNNTVHLNDCASIWLRYSINNTIMKNNISKNILRGIHIDWSSDNTIYLNNFIENGINAYSLGDSLNLWNSTEEITYTYNGSTYTNYLGNYWDDYTDVDTNNDGIWDNPYNIGGDSDNYPLVEPFENYASTPPPENQPPTASFTYSPQNPMIGEEITFDASLSTDPDGEIVSYEWGFGDGEAASGEIVTHAYSDVGDYTVTLTVTDDDGAANSSSDIITVAVYIPKWRKNIVIGDILIDENKPEEFDWLDPDTWEEIFYNGHAGIYVGNGKVVESLLWGGVKKKGIETWDYPHKRYIYLLHVKNCTREEREEAASFAEEHVGDKYCLALDIFGKSPDGRLLPDPSGVFWDTHWYCSELPWAAYWHVGKDIDRHDTDEMTEEEKFDNVVWPKDILNDPDMKKVDQHPSESDPYVGIDFLAACPVDLVVTDPDGFTISKDWIEVSGAVYYTDEDYDWDGSPDDLIYIRERKTGDYQISVVLESGAEPTDTYTLAVSAGDTTVVLAQNVQVSDIPGQPYIIESTDTGIIDKTPQSHVVSSDATGKEKNIFDMNENVYCYAGNLPANTEVKIYVVDNKDDWKVGDSLIDVSNGEKTVTTNSSGGVWPPENIWSSPLTAGKYDIVVDIDNIGFLDPGEPIDSWTTTGFEPIPEFTTIAIPVAIVLGLIFLISRRKRKK